MAAEYALVVDGASKACYPDGTRPAFRLLHGKARTASKKVPDVETDRVAPTPERKGA